MLRWFVFLIILCILCCAIGKIQQDDVETVVNNKDAIDKKINDLTKDKSKGNKKSPKDLIKDEKKHRSALKLNIKKYGKNSVEVSKTLNELGRTLYLQDKLDEALDVSLTILAITEHIHAGAATGTDDDIEDEMYDDENIAMSLGNVANVAFKLKLTDLVELTSKRQLYIVLKLHGNQSKEDVRQRAIMLQHEVKAGTDIKYMGMRHKEYKKGWIEWQSKRGKTKSVLDEL